MKALAFKRDSSDALIVPKAFAKLFEMPTAVSRLSKPVEYQRSGADCESSFTVEHQDALRIIDFLTPAMAFSNGRRVVIDTEFRSFNGRAALEPCVDDYNAQVRIAFPKSSTNVRLHVPRVFTHSHKCREPGSIGWRYNTKGVAVSVSGRNPKTVCFETPGRVEVFVDPIFVASLMRARSLTHQGVVDLLTSNMLAWCGLGEVALLDTHMCHEVLGMRAPAAPAILADSYLLRMLRVGELCACIVMQEQGVSVSAKSFGRALCTGNIQGDTALSLAFGKPCDFSYESHMIKRPASRRIVEQQWFWNNMKVRGPVLKRGFAFVGPVASDATPERLRVMSAIAQKFNMPVAGPLWAGTLYGERRAVLRANARGKTSLYIHSGVSGYVAQAGTSTPHVVAGALVGVFAIVGAASVLPLIPGATRTMLNNLQCIARMCNEMGGVIAASGNSSLKGVSKNASETLLEAKETLSDIRTATLHVASEVHTEAVHLSTKADTILDKVMETISSWNLAGTSLFILIGVTLCIKMCTGTSQLYDTLRGFGAKTSVPFVAQMADGNQVRDTLASFVTCSVSSVLFGSSVSKGVWHGFDTIWRTMVSGAAFHTNVAKPLEWFMKVFEECVSRLSVLLGLGPVKIFKWQHDQCKDLVELEDVMERLRSTPRDDPARHDNLVLLRVYKEIVMSSRSSFPQALRPRVDKLLASAQLLLSKGQIMARRPEPVAIMVSGGRGVGKSDIMKLIARVVIEECYPHRLHVSEQAAAHGATRVVDDEVFYAMHNDKFLCEGYRGQVAFMWDDVGAYNPATSTTTPPGEFLLCALTSNPYYPAQAEAQNKGTIPFTSPLVIMSTNHTSNHSLFYKTMENQSAMARRMASLVVSLRQGDSGTFPFHHADSHPGYVCATKGKTLDAKRLAQTLRMNADRAADVLDAVFCFSFATKTEMAAAYLTDNCRATYESVGKKVTWAQVAHYVVAEVKSNAAVYSSMENLSGKLDLLGDPSRAANTTGFREAMIVPSATSNPTQFITQAEEISPANIMEDLQTVVDTMYKRYSEQGPKEGAEMCEQILEQLKMGLSAEDLVAVNELARAQGLYEEARAYLDGKIPQTPTRSKRLAFYQYFFTTENGSLADTLKRTLGNLCTGAIDVVKRLLDYFMIPTHVVTLIGILLAPQLILHAAGFACTLVAKVCRLAMSAVYSACSYIASLFRRSKDPAKLPLQCQSVVDGGTIQGTVLVHKRTRDLHKVFDNPSGVFDQSCYLGKNVAIVKSASGTHLGNAIRVEDDYFLIPLHFVLGATHLEFQVPGVERTVVFKPSGDNYVRVPSGVPSEYLDAVIVHLPQFEPSRGKSLLSAFLTEDDLRQLETSPRLEPVVLVQAKEGLRVHAGMASMPLKYHVYADSHGHQFSNGRLLSYEMETHLGFCGSLVATARPGAAFKLPSNPGGQQRRVLGIHVAGLSNGATGLCQVLTREQLKRAIEKTNVVGVAQADVLPPSGACYENLRPAQDPTFVPHMSSKIQPTHCVDEVKQTLADMGFEMNVPVKLENFNPNSFVEHKKVEVAPIAREYFVAALMHHRAEWEAATLAERDRKVLEHAEVVCGTSDGKLAALHLGDGCLHPLNKMGFSVKRDVVTKDWIHPKFAEMVATAEDTLASGGEYAFECTMTPKDELRRPAKAEVPRSIFPCPFLLTYLVRKYFGQILRWFFDNNVGLGYLPGLQVYGEWGKVINTLTKKGVIDVASASFTDADIKAFDQSQAHELSWDIFNCLVYPLLAIPGDARHANILRGLWKATLRFNLLVSPEGKGFKTHVVTFNQSLASGVPLTTFINSVYSRMSHVSICMRALVDADLVARDSAASYVAKNASILTYGDDMIGAMMRALLDLDPNFVIHYGKDLGLTITPGDKTAVDIQYKALHDVSVLKRRSRKVTVQLAGQECEAWMGLLEPTSILSSLGYWKGDTKHRGPDVWAAKLTSALYEIVPHLQAVDTQEREAGRKMLDCVTHSAASAPVVYRAYPLGIPWLGEDNPNVLATLRRMLLDPTLTAAEVRGWYKKDAAQIAADA